MESIIINFDKTEIDIIAKKCLDQLIQYLEDKRSALLTDCLVLLPNSDNQLESEKCLAKCELLTSMISEIKENIEKWDN